jgi:hypothetical protein
VTKFDVVSILVYSHILLTIVKSKSHCANPHADGTQKNHRILIASIRNLGRCPCPRCLIPLDRVANMGMRRDMTQRESLARIDDVDRRGRVAAARKSIYEKNLSINGVGVKRLLQEDSLVPTAVRNFQFTHIYIFYCLFFRTLFRANFLSSDFACSSCSLSTSCMRSKLAFGRRSLFTFYAF